MTEIKIFCNADCKYNKGHCQHPENLNMGCYGGIDRCYVEKCDLLKVPTEIIEHNKMVDNPCYGCVYENIDDTTEDIGKCVCCKRNVDFAKNDYYTQKEGE